MGKIIRLTESDLNRIVKNVISEKETSTKKPLRSYNDYEIEIRQYFGDMKQTFDDLRDFQKVINKDKSLTKDQKDDLISWIQATLEDLFGAFLD